MSLEKLKREVAAADGRVFQVAYRHPNTGDTFYLPEQYIVEGAALRYAKWRNKLLGIDHWVVCICGEAK